MRKIQSVDNTNAGVKRPRKSRDAILYGMLLAAVLPYLNTVTFSFVYDDDYQVASNPYLRSFHYLKQILVTPVWSFKYAHVATNYYRPLMSLQYLLLYQAYGPLAYVFHLGNVLLHAAVILLLFAITRRLFASERMAFLSTVIFALHPIHTESVAWVAAVPDLQLSVFLLCSLWFYLDFGEPARRKWWTPLALGVSFSLALLSKEPAIALPVLAMAYEHFLRADHQITSWKQKVGRYSTLWIIVGLYLGARIWLIGGLVPKLQRPTLSWPRTFLSAASLFGDYVNKLVWPVQLKIFYPFVASTSLFNPGVLIGFAWISGLILLCWILWKRNPPLILGVLLMVGTLAPTLNARWLPGNVFAERYLYVPSMGFSWLVASGLLALWDAGFVRRQLWLRVSMVVALLLIAGLAVARIVTRDEVWRDDLTLFSSAVIQFPGNSSLHADLGFAYWAARKEEDAIREWKLAIEEDPNNYTALDDLGMVARVHGRYAEAVPLLQRALKLQPQLTNSLINLARSFAGLGQTAEAEAQFRAAILSSPLDWDAQNQLAHFYFDLGRLDDAQERFLASVSVLPNADAFDGLGDIALERGQSSLAEQYFRRAAGLDKYDHHALYRLVLIYGESGRTSEALKEFKLAESIGSDPLEKQAKALIEKISKQ